MATLVMLNNFLHDFCAAGWLFGSVLLWLTIRKKNPEVLGDKNVVDILRITLFLMRLSLAGIIVFGLVRLAAYKNHEWNASAGQNQVVLLIVKHLIFAAIFVSGLICYLRTYRFVGKRNYEKE